MISHRIVEAIFGQEPQRDQELPLQYHVNLGWRGNLSPPVEQIIYREQYMGDHSLAWFDVKAGGEIVATVSARAVTEIRYQPEAAG